MKDFNSTWNPKGPRRKTWTHSVQHPDANLIRENRPSQLGTISKRVESMLIRPFGTPTAFLVNSNLCFRHHLMKGGISVPETRIPCRSWIRVENLMTEPSVPIDPLKLFRPGLVPCPQV